MIGQASPARAAVTVRRLLTRIPRVLMWEEAVILHRHRPKIRRSSTLRPIRLVSDWIAPSADVRQVMVTPMIHTTAAKRVDVSSSSIEIPTARKAALVDGHAVRAPTRWTSDA